VFLDSNHTHNHVLTELNYMRLLLPKVATALSLIRLLKICRKELFPNAPGTKATIPKLQFGNTLRQRDRFEIDKDFEAKLLITVSSRWLSQMHKGLDKKMDKNTRLRPPTSAQTPTSISPTLSRLAWLGMGAFTKEFEDRIAGVSRLSTRKSSPPIRDIRPAHWPDCRRGKAR